MSAIIKEKIPNFQQLWNNYPKGKSEDVKALIGGKVNYGWITNTCAIRMSRAFNYSGKKLVKDTSDLNVISGADKNWYAFRVREFKKYLTDNFGPPDIIYNNGRLNAAIPSVLKGKKGVILFEVNTWDDATGHVTLWDGKVCADSDCYFGKAEKILLWKATK